MPMPMPTPVHKPYTLTTYCFLLTTHYSLLTTFYLLHISARFVLVGQVTPVVGDAAGVVLAELRVQLDRAIREQVGL